MATSPAASGTVSPGTLQPDAAARFLAALDGSLPVSARDLDRRAMAHDASHYLLIPEAIGTPANTQDVRSFMAAAAAGRTPLVFRSGGTSLSGQALSDGVMLDTRKNFRAVHVLDGGARVRAQPGATVRQVNARLAPHGRKLGPDPASESACTIGGVVANNSSGMSCGTESNTYRTLDSMIVVLPSGTVLDTASPDADRQLREREPALHEGLLRLRRRVSANPESVRTIRRLFAMKNTMGYGLNAFLDFETPADILEHLMIGSEGTLGFIAEATFRTVEARPHAAAGLMIFPTLRAATAALPELAAAGLAAIELMDATSLRIAQRQSPTPPSLAAVQVQGHAGLLVEYQASGAEELAHKQQLSLGFFAAQDLAAPFSLSTGAAERAALWHIRKGLYPTVAGGRPAGTNALLEDIAVPVPALLETCEQLLVLFGKHKYQDSVIFGHAKDGNIHFMLTERFDDPAQLARYQEFTEEMVALVLDQGGTLKAEHGTGRIMAPFVARQYGQELFEVMQEVKTLFDPAGLLNPGVMLSEDPQSYVHHLKTALPVEEEVDRCVECGYCEPVCPSKDLTLTPRQRIVVRREIAAAEFRGETALAASLRKDYEYDGVQTCAVDGLCAGACPVLINTGDLVRRLRAENQGALADKGWETAAKHWGTTAAAGGLGLSAAKILPAPLVKAATKLGRLALGADNVPLYDDELPGGGRRRSTLSSTAADADAVYFPACIGSMFGPAGDGSGQPGGGVSHAFLELCRAAGVRVTIPSGIDSFCCGTPWKSKGLPSGYNVMKETVLPALWAASDGGRLPIVCDASSCTEGLLTMQGSAVNGGAAFAASDVALVPDYGSLQFVDAVQFAHGRLLPRLAINNPLATLALHPTCSSTQLGLNGALEGIGAAIAGEVVVPKDWGCCAYAGDRGLLHPELTASATKAEAEEINQRSYA
ncbi:MAG TPA: FAD-binding and (Fe-S)-binding domain-containing protein, partial [Arthrobacter sp.]